MYVYETCEQDSLCPCMYICVHLSVYNVYIHTGTECVCLFVCVCVLGLFSPIFCFSLTLTSSLPHTFYSHKYTCMYFHVCVPFPTLPLEGRERSPHWQPWGLVLDPCAAPSHTAGVRSVHSLPSPARTPTHLYTCIVLKFSYVYVNILKYIARSLRVCMHFHFF